MMALKMKKKCSKSTNNCWNVELKSSGETRHCCRRKLWANGEEVFHYFWSSLRTAPGAHFQNVAVNRHITLNVKRNRRLSGPGQCLFPDTNAAITII